MTQAKWSETHEFLGTSEEQNALREEFKSVGKYDYQDVLDALEEVKTREGIDKHLWKLKASINNHTRREISIKDWATLSIKKRYELLEEFLDDRNEPIAKAVSVIKDPKAAIADVADSTVQKIKEKVWFSAIMEKLSSKFNGIFESIWNSISTKFMAFIWAIFGKLGLSNFMTDELPADEDPKETPEWEDDKPVGDEEPVEGNNDVEDKEWAREKKEVLQWKYEQWYSLLGRTFLKKISSSELLFKWNNNFPLFVKQVSQSWVSYWELQEMRQSLVSGSDIKNDTATFSKQLWITDLNLSHEHFTGMIDALIWWASQYLTTHLNIKKIVQSDHFQKRFGNSFDSLIWQKVKDISVEHIIFLIWYSLPIWILEWTTNMLPDMSDLWEFSEMISEELVERRWVFFSKPFTQKMATSWFAAPWLLDSELLTAEFKWVEWINTDLEKFIAFTNSVLSTLSTDRFSIIKDFDTNFIDKVSPKDIYSLYLLFDWETNLRNLQWMNKVLMYSWILNLTKNTTIRDEYIKTLVTGNGSNENDYLEPEETALFSKLLWEEAYKVFLESAVNAAGSFTTAIQGTTKETLSEYGVDLTWLQWNYEIIDYTVLAILMWWNYLAYKLPLPLPWKIIIGGIFTSGGSAQLVWILKNRWVIESLLKESVLPDEVKHMLEKYKDADTSLESSLSTLFSNTPTA